MPFPSAGTARLVEVRVTGSQRFPAAEIIRATGLRVGDEVALEAFQDAANKLAETGVFANVQYKYFPSPAGIAVEFHLTDASKLLPCKFDNFVWFSAEELQKELRARVPLFDGDAPPTGNLPDQIDAALESLLREHGIQGAVLHAVSGSLGGAIEAYLFSVEGITIAIGQVEYQGVNQLDKSLLQVAGKPLLGTNFSQSFVSDFASRNLGPIYRQRGFLKVEFANPIAEVVKGGSPNSAANVTIPVREGSQYRLSGIQWSGNIIFADTELMKHIHLAQGKLADAVQLGQDLESIRGLYGSRGYVTASVRPIPDFQDESRTVIFALQVHEGDLYRMGKFEITGVDPSLAETLQKIFRPQSGEPFDTGFQRPFLAQIGKYLPRNLQGRAVSFREVPNTEARTVDVFMTFTRGVGP